MKRYYRKRYYRKPSTPLLPALFLIVLLYSSLSTAIKGFNFKYLPLILFVCFLVIVGIYEYIKQSSKKHSSHKQPTNTSYISKLDEIEQFTQRKKATQLKSFKELNSHQLKQRIRSCTPRTFEILCYELFKASSEYDNIILTQAKQDGGKDIIATKINGDKVYIECKRYTDKATRNENFMIGREICQKLMGAMSSDGVHYGIIITTGNIHRNATEYIAKLHTNTPYRIKFLLADDIVNMIKDSQDNPKLIALLS